MNINTKEYWDNRFKSKNWEYSQGIEQSNMFADMIIRNINQRVLYETNSALDVGCGLGQFCKKWSEATGTEDVEGYDFSEECCIRAKELNPSFDFLFEFPKRDYDAVFSSNVFEHVDDFWPLLNRMFNCAEKFIVLLVPFNSFIGGEHVRTFSGSEFPEEVGDFIQIQNKILKSSELLWFGEQQLVVYTRKK